MSYFVKDIRYGTTRFDSNVLYARITNPAGQTVHEGVFEHLLLLIEGKEAEVLNWEEVSNKLFELRYMN